MAAAPTSPTGPARRPGWMSIPGGPKEPNRTDLRAKLQAISSERSKCFERINEIRALFSERPDDSERDDSRREVNELRQRVRAIEAQRRKEREVRFSKDQEMRRLRNERREMERKLLDLGRELGDFRSLDDIEGAIDFVNMKMETGSGDLKFEKICLKRLSMLEEAKALVMQLAPMEEAIKETDEREENLQLEYKEIIERIEQLDATYTTEASKKLEKEKALQKAANPQQDRARLAKERDDVRAKLTALNEQADAVRKAFDEGMEAWNKWKEVAQQKYREQQEAARKEREARWLEREKQRKLAKKAAKLAKRRNPYESEIDACTTLIRYLEDKTVAAKREREEQDRLRKLATFDARASAPPGLKLAVQDDEWLFQDRTKKVTKPAPKKTHADPAAAAASKPSKGEPRDRVCHHSDEKHRLFQFAKVDAPLAYGQIAATVELLKKKRAEFESHIAQNIDDVSTDEELEDEGVAPSEAVTASEAPAAAAAAEAEPVAAAAE